MNNQIYNPYANNANTYTFTGNNQPQQNDTISVISISGGVIGIRNRLNDFSNQFAQSTNQTPQQVGMQIQQQMSPEQFQMFANIADIVTGRRH